MGLKSGRSNQSLLTDGIFDFNIDASAEGNIRIALWPEWRAMLDDLRDIGPVWRLVRANHCALAVEGNYPMLAYSANGSAAMVVNPDGSMHYDFKNWRQAVAFDSGCCCGRKYGFEIANSRGEIFYRVCLARGTGITSFVEWVQAHQATGLEIERGHDEDDFCAQESFVAMPLAIVPGTLDVSPYLLRTVLLSAANREIPLEITVAEEGMTQSAHIEMERATENQGWMIFSGPRRILYVESEPVGTLRAETRTVEGESIWTLSLMDAHGQVCLRVHTGTEHRSAWNSLIREQVLIA